ncbi:MAG TPA: FGGY-family carbohydrate kinase, partial [Candidatus Nitrosopolaris sp.]|nr:FGGY-family carbohydrate kinase [Candidatus Nitrosopolaris sp.]
PLLTVSGGMTRSPTLTRVLANTLGTPVEVASLTESASLGCAILAAVGAGVYGDVADAVQAMTHVRRVDPEPACRAEYEDRYRKWREVYALLQTWTL